MTPLQLKNLAVKVLDEHKAENITSIDVSEITSITDYMIICSATSTRHIKALADHLISTSKEHKVRPLGAEGIDGSDEWALVDLGDIIVHIMLATTREFYSLEKLWQVSEDLAKPARQKTVKDKTVKSKKVSSADKTKAKPKAKTATTRTRKKATTIKKTKSGATIPKKPVKKTKSA